MSHNLFNTLQTFTTGEGKSGQFYSLPQLEEAGRGAGLAPARLDPHRARIGAAQLRRASVVDRGRRPRARQLAGRTPSGRRRSPSSSRASLLQDFTGVPLLVDLAAMRSAVAAHGARPGDHRAARPGRSRHRPLGAGRLLPSPDALQHNMEMEFKRNRARYQFLKWGMQAFDGFNVVPPGIGIVHQVNLEYLAQGRVGEGRRLLPRHARRHRLAHDDDQRARHRRLGRRRHRGRGGDARPARLFPDARRRRRAPDRRAARGRDGDRPRAAHHRDAPQGEGRRQVRRVLWRGRGVAARRRPRDDRQHGARIRRDDGLFPGGREVAASICSRPGARRSRSTTFRDYYKAQGLFGIPRAGEIDYSTMLDLDLATIEPSVAGPKRPQDRIELSSSRRSSSDLLRKPAGENGYGKRSDESSASASTLT